MSEIKVDTVAEKTSANGVTVDGLNIKDSKLVTANSVVETNLTDNIVTLAKMASGTDGNIISYDASGNPVAIATGNDGQVLTSTGAGSPPAFETLPASGKIGQAVTGTNNAYNVSSSSTSYTDVLSASGTTWETTITPTATSSKILILPSVYIRNFNTSSNEARGSIKMMSKIGSGSYADIDVATDFGAYDYGGSGILVDNQYVPIQLYSPNTTSEVKIKFQIKARSSSMTIQTSWSSTTHFSRVTLLEVLA